MPLGSGMPQWLVPFWLPIVCLCFCVMRQVSGWPVPMQGGVDWRVSRAGVFWSACWKTCKALAVMSRMCWPGSGLVSVLRLLRWAQRSGPPSTMVLPQSNRCLRQSPSTSSWPIWRVWPACASSTWGSHACLATMDHRHGARPHSLRSSFPTAGTAVVLARLGEWLPASG